MKKNIINLMKGISGVIPKKKNLWLFGSWEGKNYSDNSKYMFEYVIKEHPEIIAIWLTKNNDVLKRLRSKGYLCYKKWSIQGIWYAFRAEAAFETEGDGDVSSFMNGTTIIQLFHGIGAKALKWVNDDGTPLYSDEFMEPYKRSYWMATSELYIETFHKMLGIPMNHFFVTGYPRNDMFIEKPYNEFMEHFIKTHNYANLIIYMPTHRNFGKEGNKFINIAELKKVDKLLQEKNICMFYKPHIHELRNFASVESDFTNIFFAKDMKVFSDPYSYIHYFDLLISDYSSIMTDFACLNKPIITFPYDLDNYMNSDAGLLDYYFDYKVGPFCYTWEEVLEETERLLADDQWKAKRENSRVKYHYYNDGKNRERVFRTVENLLNKREVYL